MSEPEKKDDEAPATPPHPWFTVALSFGITLNLAWTVAVGATVFVLTVGSPDLLDALVAWIGGGR